METPSIFTNCNYQKHKKRRHIEARESRFIVIIEVISDRGIFVKDPNCTFKND